MVNPFLWGRRNVLFLALPACLLSLVYTGPRTSTQVSRTRASQASAAQALVSPAHVRQGRFHDWSTRHALYPQVGTMAALEAARRDPRSSFRWNELEEQQQASRFALQQRNLRNFLQFRFPGRPGRFPERNSTKQHIDWSINLGTNGTAISMYPAKYTFDTTVAPSCANDFVVFPVNADGSATQPNLVAFNNLYSGNPNNGICNRAVSGNDAGISATVMWSYDFEGIAAGTVPNSPVLSLDGKKVAFVESVAGSGAHFHVLAWRSGDGTVANKQNVFTPQTFGGTGTAFVATAPVASGASGAATDLAFGTTGDTLSSPYIDYAADTAYVGNDAGVLFRFKNVFCTNPSCGTAAPSLDLTWGSGTGAVTVCSGKTMTGPVQNFYNQKIYVGCSDGKLYSINSLGTSVTSIAVGDGTTFGGVVDPPLVDGINSFVYAVSGSANSGLNGELLQTKVDFSSFVAVPIGNGGQCNIHAPTVNNAYFISPASANALIYIGGVTGNVGTCTAGGATNGTNQLYAATFGASGVLTAGAPTHSLPSGNPVGNEYAPLAEFFNTGTATDTIFVGILRNTSRGFNNLYSFNSTAGWNATPITAVFTGLGTSGIVVDNSSASNQASSIYFNALNQNAACSSPQTGPNTNGCATKLTQASLK